jgi:hypothetical protein
MYIRYTYPCTSDIHPAAGQREARTERLAHHRILNVWELRSLGRISSSCSWLHVHLYLHLCLHLRLLLHKILLQNLGPTLVPPHLTCCFTAQHAMHDSLRKHIPSRSVCDALVCSRCACVLCALTLSAIIVFLYSKRTLT